MKRAVLVLLATSMMLPGCVFADGYGPVFGLATPTNSKREWSFDSGVFGCANNFDSQASFRELIGYGFAAQTILFPVPRYVLSIPGALGFRRRIPCQHRAV